MGIITNKLFTELKRKRRGGIDAQAETGIIFGGIQHICFVYGAQTDQRLERVVAAVSVVECRLHPLTVLLHLLKSSMVGEGLQDV